MRRLAWEAIEPILRPYLNQAPSGLPSRRIPASALEKISDTEKISIARTVREVVRFIGPIVALSDPDEGLWREEVLEHLEALEALARSSRTPLTDTDDHTAARALLFLLASVGRRFERGVLEQPEALEDMLRLLPPFFGALNHQHPAHIQSRPHLRELARLISLLPGTIAHRDRQAADPPQQRHLVVDEM